MDRKILTDRALKALKPNPGGRHRDIWDAVVPGLAARVSPSGRVTFVLIGRFGSKNPTRRAIGQYGAITLERARAKARDWIDLNKQGRDPRAVEEEEKRAQLRKRAITFRAVAEDFLAEWVIGPDPERPRQRQGRKVAQVVRKDLIATWGDRSVSAITRGDVFELIKAKARVAPAQSRNTLGIAKNLFAWARDQNYGLESSPCADISPRKVIGDKIARDRVLTDEETRALWLAAMATPYPVGPLYRLLLLTGLRLNELARAHWSEFDLRKGEWTIPAARMKGKDGRARPHLVPLTPEILHELGSLPRFANGEFLFSTTHGRKPIVVGTKAKKTIDAAMLAELRKGNPKAKLTAWVNHDLRRVVRSNLAALRVPEEVSEAVLSHTRGGIVGVYNVHRYETEKREALSLWAARLREIVEPKPPSGENVVPLKARG